VAAAVHPIAAVRIIKQPHAIIPENKTLLSPNNLRTSLSYAYPAKTKIKVAITFIEHL
jgi:hypothetical protein